MIPGNSNRRRFFVRLFAATGFVFLNQSLWAHARLVRSSPKSDGEVQEPLKKLELWFNERLDDGFHTVQVYLVKDLSNKERKNFAKGKPRVDEKDRTHLIVDLDEMPPGEYAAEFRVLSRDGHSAPGRWKFKIVGRR